VQQISASALVGASAARPEPRAARTRVNPQLLAPHVREPLAYGRAKANPRRGALAGGVTGLGGFTSAAPLAALFEAQNKPGISASTQITELGEAGNVTPPDTTGAIGSANYVEIVNEEIAVYERSNLTLHSGSPLGLASFTGGTAPCDPQIKYDAQSERWFYSALRCDGTTKSNELYLGWSKSSNPSSLAGTSETSGWCKFKVATQPATSLDDYDKLGVDGAHVTIGANLFASSSGAFQTAQILVAPKPPTGTITSCAAPTVHVFGSPSTPLTTSIGDSAFTPEPATVAGTASGGYVVSADFSTETSGNHLMVWQVGGSAESPTFEPKGDVEVASFSSPPNVPQPEGSTDKIDSLDGRFTQAVAAPDPSVEGGAETIWTQQTIASGEDSVVRWYEIVPSKLEVHQSGTVSDASGFAFNAAIAPTLAGGAALVYNVGGHEAKVQVKAQSRIASTPLGTMSGPITLRESSAIDSDFTCPSQPYGTEHHAVACRWGDYAGASVDPSHPSLVWGSDQLNGPRGEHKAFGNLAQWATQNFALVVEPPPSVTQVQQHEGPPAGGTAVTIAGTNFTGATQVRFGQKNAASFHVKSETEIEAASPPGAGTVNVTVTTPVGTSPAGAADEFSYLLGALFEFQGIPYNVFETEGLAFEAKVERGNELSYTIPRGAQTFSFGPLVVDGKAGEVAKVQLDSKAAFEEPEPGRYKVTGQGIYSAVAGFNTLFGEVLGHVGVACTAPASVTLAEVPIVAAPGGGQKRYSAAFSDDCLLEPFAQRAIAKVTIQASGPAEVAPGQEVTLSEASFTVTAPTAWRDELLSMGANEIRGRAASKATGVIVAGP
jgi:hypothetical protein